MLERRSPFRGWGGRQWLESAVVSSRRLADQTHGIVVQKPAGLSFLPTQFTFLSLETDEGPDVRPMSIATSPTRPYLEYAIRASSSPFKRAFAALRPGDRVGVQGPFGDFVLQEDRPAVLLAGGIGITPLKGMAEYASDKSLPIPVRLVYSNRSEEEIAYRTELEELQRRNLRLRVVYTLTRDAPRGWDGSRGRIGSSLLEEAVEGLDEPVYYICGKPEMVSAMLGLLSVANVPESDIMFEVFRGYRG